MKFEVAKLINEESCLVCKYLTWDDSGSQISMPCCSLNCDEFPDLSYVESSSQLYEHNFELRCGDMFEFGGKFFRRVPNLGDNFRKSIDIDPVACSEYLKNTGLIEESLDVIEQSEDEEFFKREIFPDLPEELKFVFSEEGVTSEDYYENNTDDILSRYQDTIRAEQTTRVVYVGNLYEAVINPELESCACYKGCNRITGSPFLEEIKSTLRNRQFEAQNG